MKIIFILIILSWSTISFCQNIKPTNIFYRKIEDKIEIFYDLPRNTDTLNVKIYFRKKSDPKTRYPIKHTTGSIGTGVFSGKLQKVTWDYKKEPALLFTGSGFYYQIIVRKLKTTVTKRGKSSAFQ